MIAPLRETETHETNDGPALSEAARAVVARMLPRLKREDEAPAIPAWQAWLLVTWLAVTALAYAAITLGLWRN